MKKKVRIDQGRTVPSQLRIPLSVVTMALMIYLINSTKTPGIPFMVLFIACSSLLYVLWTSRKILELEPAPSLIIQYHWIFGYKARRTERRETAKYITIKERDEAADEERHEVFLVFNNGTSLFLISRDDREAVEKIAQDISRKLGTPIHQEHIQKESPDANPGP